MKRIHALYFSPTGTTKEIVYGIAKKITAAAGGMTALNELDFTSPRIREKAVSFSAEDIVIVGVPVYAGRVPNILLKYLNTMSGSGTLAVAVVLYGNRSYDDALIELKDILEAKGFKVVAAGAFIGEHSFSDLLACKRPDANDLLQAENFADQIYKKISSPEKIPTIAVKGNKPYRNYYVPKDEKGNPVDLRKVTPRTASSCVDCKICVEACPMGSIDLQDAAKLRGICIKCGACIKKCPVQAKYFDDKDYWRHKVELEMECADRKEPELFL